MIKPRVAAAFIVISAFGIGTPVPAHDGPHTLLNLGNVATPTTSGSSGFVIVADDHGMAGGVVVGTAPIPARYVFTCVDFADAGSGVHVARLAGTTAPSGPPSVFFTLIDDPDGDSGIVTSSAGPAACGGEEVSDVPAVAGADVTVI